MVYKTDMMRTFCVDQVSRQEQFHRVGSAYQTNHPAHFTMSNWEAQPGYRHTETSIVCSDTNVESTRKFASASYTCTLDHADGRLADRFGFVHGSIESCVVQRRLSRILPPLLKFANIGTCRKRLISHATEDNHSNGGILSEINQNTAKFVPHLKSDRVPSFQIIEGDGSDLICNF